MTTVPFWTETTTRESGDMYRIRNDAFVSSINLKDFYVLLISVADPGFCWGLGAPTPKVGVPTYFVYQKLHENFKKLDPQEVRVPGAPLDPSMNLVIVLCELRKFCINFNKERDICEWVSNAPDLTGCEMT